MIGIEKQVLEFRNRHQGKLQEFENLWKSCMLANKMEKLNTYYTYSSILKQKSLNKKRNPLRQEYIQEFRTCFILQLF